jgi:hypothetical protein
MWKESFTTPRKTIRSRRPLSRAYRPFTRPILKGTEAGLDDLAIEWWGKAGG